MDVKKFRTWFEQNDGPWSQIDWSLPMELPEEMKQVLGRSLAIFQLGETGDGSTLLRYAQTVKDDPVLVEYPATLNLFINEEKRHAAALLIVLERLGIPPLQKQWSNSAFQYLRRFLRLDFEVQILLTVELIAEAWYALLYHEVNDPPIRETCGLMVKEEKWHTRFHAAYFGYRQSQWSTARSWLWRTQFRLIHRVICEVVWWDHRPCFQALKIDRVRYLDLCKRAMRTFLREMKLSTNLTSPNPTGDTSSPRIKLERMPEAP
ncbi:MAG: hypothetical protein ACI9R3_006068 [Verrucomicrobiales bacterium]|jgi:hypothetical protein